MIGEIILFICALFANIVLYIWGGYIIYKAGGFNDWSGDFWVGVLLVFFGVFFTGLLLNAIGV